MNLTTIPSMIDISAVRTDVCDSELKEVVDAAKKYNLLCVFAMPCYTKQLVEMLMDEPEILVGGVVGFPSGADTTSVKVAAAKELVSFGVDELDMVINVGALKSGRYDEVINDIHSVIEAGNGLPVKSILEVSYLTDDEIKRGSLLAAEAGVTFVKTGTGWGPKPTTVEHIKLIASVVGKDAKIKAAGGIRTLDTILEMTAAGCSRFGIGLSSAVKIMQEICEREGIPFEGLASKGIKSSLSDSY